LKPWVPLGQPQRVGRFLQRLNRFAVAVALPEGAVVAHLPNSGRMTELLVAGRRVVLVARPSPGRRTAWDMALVSYRGAWVSVDSRLPSALAAAALQQRAIPEWDAAMAVRREVTWGDSRFDLEMWDGDRRWYLETKSVNLVEGGRALFPDAPTTRGARHMRTLIAAREAGHGAGVLFVIQRADARVLAPFDAADPDFGRALREAAAAGVTVLAYGCRVTPKRMTLAGRVPVEL
jgi:sugar fermentation stimulation protein A